MMQPQISKARSLLEASKSDMEFTQTLPISSASAATIIRNVYECLRMLGEARLALAAIKTADHEAQIKELLRMQVTTRRPIAAINMLKRLRHNINYKGYRPSVSEAKDALDIADACFDALAEKLEKEIEE